MRSTNKTVNSVDLEVAREMLALSESKWFGLDVAWVRILDQCECLDCAVGSSVTVQIMRYEDEEWVELCGGKAGAISLSIRAANKLIRDELAYKGPIRLALGAWP